jgi:hypothetical protein
LNPHAPKGTSPSIKPNQSRDSERIVLLLFTRHFRPRVTPLCCLLMLRPLEDSLEVSAAPPVLGRALPALRTSDQF